MSIDPTGIRISGPLAGFAEGYGTELAQLGYAPASVRLQKKVLADLSDWLSSHGMAAADLRRSDLDRFLRHRRAAGHTRYASIRAVRPVLDYLQRFEVVPRQASDAVLGPIDVMLDRFWRYLTIERALAAVTARAYLDMVRPFVQGRLSADCRALDLERLTAADIISFVVTRCPRQSRGAAKLTVPFDRFSGSCISTASLKSPWSLPYHRLQAGDWSGCRRGWLPTRFDAFSRRATTPRGAAAGTSPF